MVPTLRPAQSIGNPWIRWTESTTTQPGNTTTQPGRWKIYRGETMPDTNFPRYFDWGQSPVLIGELDTCITGPDGEHACYANGNECLCACNQCRIEAEPENKSMVMEGQIAYQKILFDQYRGVCQEIFNQQIPVAAGCDKLTFISQQLDHIEKQYGIDWRTITR